MLNERYINRELSWLDFDKRVLALAHDERVPLLERAKFLAIVNDNLDEFFQVRVSGLMEQVAVGVTATSPDGMTPQQQLLAIRSEVDGLYADQTQLWRKVLSPALEMAGISIVMWKKLTDEDKDYLYRVFEDRLFPVLTPLAVDPAHPFPYISNLSLNLAVVVRNPEAGAQKFARVKVPSILPRFVALPDGTRFVPLEQVIAANLGDLFPGMEIVEHQPFRVTRNADIELEEEEAGDLMSTMRTSLNLRRFGRVVRLEVERNINPAVLDLLTRELRISDAEIYRVRGLLGLGGLWALAASDHPELKYPVHVPAVPDQLADGDRSIFDAITESDIFVHHPYDSFMRTTAEFLAQAARDPKVLAIKQIVYRTSAESPIVSALIAAAQAGKQVLALIELKARFDEERNIEWARSLEEAGVHVVYGFVGLKTHAKTALVVRDEGDAIARYVHVGTGNYNHRTATVYEDVGIFTKDEEMGLDIGDLFNFLSGYSKQKAFRKVVVAPADLRARVLELIREEAETPDGHVVMKMNSLLDREVIDTLYEASQMGTRIDLLIRGICSLRPGVPGLSETITVRSILGRYLEHSRIFRFGRPERGFVYYIGSADMMPRNLDRRVELMAPVEDPAVRARIEEILDLARADDHLAWQLQSDGTWMRRTHKNDINLHDELEERARRRAGFLDW